MKASLRPIPARYLCVLMVCVFGQLVQHSEAVVINSNFSLNESQALAAGELYEATGWVMIQEGASTFRGTGVLIASDWVLTAAHNWLADSVTGLSFNLGGVTYQASPQQWHQHPGWVKSPTVSLGQGNDLALFRLSSQIAGVTPARLYSGTGELGTTVTILGAGLAGTAVSGPQANSAAILYAATNLVDRVVSFDEGGALLALDFDDGTLGRNSLRTGGLYTEYGQAVTNLPGATILGSGSSSNISTLEGTSTFGDSGGPAYADFGNGLELVGLVSWGVNPTQPGNLYGSGYGDITYLSRVSAATNWINATIPEPNTLLLLVSSMLAGLCGRGRYRMKPV